MTTIYRNIAIWSVLALVIVLGIVGPRLRRDNSNVDPTILHELVTTGQISWEAPMLELLAQPVAHVDSYDPKTQVAVVGQYSWFGLRVGGSTINGCQYGKPGNFNPNFGCYGGDHEDYLF